MRVISQNGMFDFPYEQISVCLQGNVVLCHSMFDMGKYKVLGNYSTEEKAEKAMEMLREKYLSRMELDGGYDIVNKCYVQPNYWVLPKLFQFPQDSEVEV